ncbi:MAG: hypothetical protein ABIR96_02835 [Bdellovibrionota bacterium]
MKILLSSLGCACVLGSLAWLPYVAITRAKPQATSSFDQTTLLGNLQCASGTCLLRRAGSSVLQPIPVGAKPPVLPGDDVVTLDATSLLVMNMSKGAELRLKSIGSVAAQKGEHNFSADELIASGIAKKPSEEQLEKKPKKLVNTSLFFLGDLEVKLHSPLPHSQILAEKFPQKFMFSFTATLPPHISRSEEKRVEQWHLVDLANEEKIKRVASLTLVRSKDDMGEDRTFNFSTLIPISTPGEYGLVPEGRPLVMEEVKTRFTVKDLKGNLRRQLKESLQSLKEGSPDPVFLEQ